MTVMLMGAVNITRIQQNTSPNAVVRTRHTKTIKERYNKFIALDQAIINATVM